LRAKLARASFQNSFGKKSAMSVKVSVGPTSARLTDRTQTIGTRP
jgi:hypothetical protein